MPCYEYKGKRPWIAPDAWVAPNAVLIGDVRIHSGASVWWGSVLRGDMDRIELGERSCVQDNSTVHADEGVPTIIGPDVTVGHSALVHSSVIEGNVLIGSRAVLTGRNRVASGTIVAAGAVLGEGYEAPAGVLVLGVPAKVIRELRPEDARWTHRAAAHYAELSAHYREHVHEVEPDRRPR